MPLQWNQYLRIVKVQQLVPKRNDIYFFLSLLINGSHSNPIITGIIPTYVPIIAKNPASSRLGSNAGAEASISFSNLVQSSIVSPIV